mgnify:CR=1 FL=1
MQSADIKTPMISSTVANCPSTLKTRGGLRDDPCNLCPRLCGAAREHGFAGVCGADDTLRVARAALHFWEEPPLSGTAGSGAVFFAGCPLHCVYCQNAIIAEGGQRGVAINVQRLAQIFLELQGKGALNINCVTPTHYSLRIREAVRLAREQGLSLPIVWNTSSYERVQVVHELADTVDIYLADFKYADARLAKAYSRAGDYADVALRALDAMVTATGSPQFDEYHGEMRMTRGVIVRHLLLPGCLDDSKRVVRLLHEHYGDEIMLSIMNQYTPVLATAAAAGDEHARKQLALHPELARVVSDDEYEQLLDYADSLGIEDYFWQEGAAAKESFVPAWDGEGVLPVDHETSGRVKESVDVAGSASADAASGSEV